MSMVETLGPKAHLGRCDQTGSSEVKEEKHTGIKFIPAKKLISLKQF